MKAIEQLMAGAQAGTDDPCPLFRFSGERFILGTETRCASPRSDSEAPLLRPLAHNVRQANPWSSCNCQLSDVLPGIKNVPKAHRGCTFSMYRSILVWNACLTMVIGLRWPLRQPIVRMTAYLSVDRMGASRQIPAGYTGSREEQRWPVTSSRPSPSLHRATKRPWIANSGLCGRSHAGISSTGSPKLPTSEKETEYSTSLEPCPRYGECSRRGA